jgi:hypothetical protein
MKSLLIATILATLSAPVAFVANASALAELNNPSRETVVDRRSHHCPKFAVILSSRCRGV